MTVSFIERELRIDEQVHVLEFPIDVAFEHGGLVIVLFAPDSNLKKFGQFHNVIAVDRDGLLVWEAELPTSNTTLPTLAGKISISWPPVWPTPPILNWPPVAVPLESHSSSFW